MEEELKKLSESLGGFCNHLESSCNAFNNSLNRRPIPLDSASSTFIQSLNRRLSVAGNELNLLESMSFDTVSFEELLGHCTQVYKKNQDDLVRLQDRLTSFGYIPDTETDQDENDGSNLDAPLIASLCEVLDTPSYPQSIAKGLEEDSLLDESLSFKHLGLSDACLATLASDANDEWKKPEMSFQEPDRSKEFESRAFTQPSLWTSELSDEEEIHTTQEMDRSAGDVITIAKDAYDNLPPYMKCLASWEDVLGAVGKINSALNTKQKTNGFYYFRADEIHTIGLGNKEKAYMLMLMRMNRFVVETTDGAIYYRVV